MGEFHCNKNRSKFVTLAVAGMPIAIVYQSLMAIAFLPMDWEFPFIGLIYKPWRLYLLMSSIIIGIAFIAAWFLPESPKFMLAQKKETEALEIMRNGYAINTGHSKEVCFGQIVFFL